MSLFKPMSGDVSHLSAEDWKFIDDQTIKYKGKITHVPSMNRSAMVIAFKEGLLTAMKHLCDAALLRRAERELKEKFITQE